MATLTVWKFDDPYGAHRAEETLVSLSKQNLITIHDAATVSWPADKRVLRRLVEVAALYPDGVVPLTQEDLASLAGTSRATVNRVLREAEERGSLKLGRGRTTLLDAAELERRGR